MTAPWLSVFPQDWQRVRLKNLVESVSAGVWGSEPGDGEGMPCIRAADFDREHLRVSLARAPLRMIPYEQARACALTPGDLVLEKSGGGEQQPVGAVVLFDHRVAAVPTNFAARIRPAAGVDPRYLNYLFAAVYWLRINMRSIKQTTGLQNLDVGSFLAEEWAVPVLGEQIQIADFLDRETARIDAVVAKKRRFAQLLESRERALVDAIVADSGPRMARVKNVVRGITSGPRGWSGHFSDTGVIFLRITNVSTSSTEVSLDGLVRVTPPEGLEALRTRAAAGDVVLSITAQIGAIGVITEGLAGCHVSQHLALLRTNLAAVEPDWLALCLFSSDGQTQLDAARYGGTKTQLSLEDVAGIRLPLPPRDRQKAILTEWRAKDARLRAARQKVEDQLSLFEEHRQGLITAAVTGQVDLLRRKA